MSVFQGLFSERNINESQDICAGYGSKLLECYPKAHMWNILARFVATLRPLRLSAGTAPFPDQAPSPETTRSAESLAQSHSQLLSYTPV